MEKILNQAQARVLGAIIEKRYTTPQYYPLTQNAVKVACNQKNARDPLTDYSDNEVFDLLRGLVDLGFLATVFVDSSRTAKYELRFDRAYELEKPDQAILAELFLRGPQTAGELRNRCERMHSFSGISELEALLAGLADKGRVKLLPKHPGQKEARWAHLFCGEPENLAPPEAAEGHPQAGGSTGLRERVEALESEVAALKARLEAIEGR